MTQTIINVAFAALIIICFFRQQVVSKQLADASILTATVRGNTNSVAFNSTHIRAVAELTNETAFRALELRELIHEFHKEDL